MTQFAPVTRASGRGSRSAGRGATRWPVNHGPRVYHKSGIWEIVTRADVIVATARSDTLDQRRDMRVINQISIAILSDPSSPSGLERTRSRAFRSLINPWAILCIREYFQHRVTVLQTVTVLIFSKSRGIGLRIYFPGILGTKVIRDLGKLRIAVLASRPYRVSRSR